MPSRATLALATVTGTQAEPPRPAGSCPGLWASTALSGKLLGFGTLGFPDRPAYSIRGPVHVSTVYNPAAYSIWVQKSTNAFILI